MNGVGVALEVPEVIDEIIWILLTAVAVLIIFFAPIGIVGRIKK